MMLFGSMKQTGMSQLAQHVWKKNSCRWEMEFWNDNIAHCEAECEYRIYVPGLEMWAG